jgi:hypothetical protein
MSDCILKGNFRSCAILQVGSKELMRGFDLHAIKPRLGRDIRSD